MLSIPGPRSRSVPIVEELESRTLLSVLTPAQVRQAYNFDQVSFGSTAGDGRGQTIAIVNAFDDPNISSDLDKFDQTFNLYQQYGASSRFLTKATPQGQPLKDPTGLWELEEALDVEWAHSIAPAAKILLVESRTDSFANLMGAVDYARQQPGVSVVSMSWGDSEFSGETAYDGYFTTPAGHSPVAFVAAAGDQGAPPLWPAVVPSVVGVGATTLHVDGSGNYQSETGWGDSGGGYSDQIPVPFYQREVQPYSMRSAPDVSYDGDPNTGFYVYTSYAENGSTGWFSVGGTSAGTPQWAALVAIADQGRALRGQAPFDATQLLNDLYIIPSSAFHDVTSGFNGYYATSGYDVVTGRGTPYADRVIQDLLGGTAISSYQSPTFHAAALAQNVPVLHPIVAAAPANAPSAAGLVFSSEGTTLPAAPTPGAANGPAATAVTRPAQTRPLSALLQAPDGGRETATTDTEAAVAPESLQWARPLPGPSAPSAPVFDIQSEADDVIESWPAALDACFAQPEWLETWKGPTAVPPPVADSPPSALLAALAVVWAGAGWDRGLDASRRKEKAWLTR